jgi:adenylylsulfate kinase
MSKVIWLTGLPCSGKTTIARDVVRKLVDYGEPAMLLDGDIMRETSISSDLGFSKDDRRTHLHRMADVANLLSSNGVTVVAAFVSPYQSIREEIRSKISGDFRDVFVDAPLKVCSGRDVKGMYEKAQKGEIKGFTGVDDPYERPEKPDLHIHTDTQSVEECSEIIVTKMGLLPNLKPGALFIGRWQPLHNGHDYLIRKALDDGKRVIIGIRRTKTDDKNPLSVRERKAIIEETYKDDDVEVVVLPDIESVNIGRKVGYDVNRIDAPDTIEGISATQIRDLIISEDSRWANYVPVKSKQLIREAFGA